MRLVNFLLGQTLARCAEEARATRLENLRTSNNRETNTMNNDERHSNRMAEQAKGQEFSLAELAQRAENETASQDHAAGIKAADQPSYTDETDADGKLTGQRDSKTNEWSAAGESTTRTNQAKTPDKLVIADALKNMGVEDTALVEYITGNKSKEQVRQELATKLASDSMIDPEDVPGRVEQMMKVIFPGEASAAKPGTPGEAKGGDADYQTMFDTLKKSSGDKFSDEQIQEYIAEKYGKAPA